MPYAQVNSTGEWVASEVGETNSTLSALGAAVRTVMAAGAPIAVDVSLNVGSENVGKEAIAAPTLGTWLGIAADAVSGLGALLRFSS